MGSLTSHFYQFPCVSYDKQKFNYIFWALKLTESWFEPIRDIFDVAVCLLGVEEVFDGVDLGVLVALENFVTTDLSIPMSSWVLPTDNSANFRFKWLENSCIFWLEQGESCSVPDILGFKVLSLLNDLRFSLSENIGTASGSRNLVFLM